jgi:ABC-type Zn uptake system ZnuABC Zn-binding protein ZnuA
MSVGLRSARIRIGSLWFILCAVGLFLLLNAVWPKRNAPAEDGKLHVVCTFLPMYVFSLNVVGDVPGIGVELLIDRNIGCPHSYTVSGQDLKKISRADVVVANGLGIEPFLDELLRGQKATRVITISDGCDVIRLKADEQEHHEEGAHESDDRHEHAKASEVNPHTWVSPQQAAVQVRTLARKLGEVDPAHAAQFQANGEAYANRLTALADRMVQASKSFTNRNIVTGHAAFDYLARDLGLNVVATLQVVPGETPSAGEMARVVDAIRKTKAAAVFWEPPYADKTADTIARDAGVPVYPLNPFNSDAGLSPDLLADKRGMYETVMLQNLATLQKALRAGPAGSQP